MSSWVTMTRTTPASMGSASVRRMAVSPASVRSIEEGPDSAGPSVAYVTCDQSLEDEGQLHVHAEVTDGSVLGEFDLLF